MRTLVAPSSIGRRSATLTASGESHWWITYTCVPSRRSASPVHRPAGFSGFANEVVLPVLAKNKVSGIHAHLTQHERIGNLP